MKKDITQKKKIVDVGKRVTAVLGIILCIIAIFVCTDIRLYHLVPYSFGADYYTESYNAAVKTVDAINGLVELVSNGFAFLFSVLAVRFLYLFFAAAKPNPNYIPKEKKVENVETVETVESFSQDNMQPSM